MRTTDRYFEIPAMRIGEVVDVANVTRLNGVRIVVRKRSNHRSSYRRPDRRSEKRGRPSIGPSRRDAAPNSVMVAAGLVASPQLASSNRPSRQYDCRNRVAGDGLSQPSRSYSRGPARNIDRQSPLSGRADQPESLSLVSAASAPEPPGIVPQSMIKRAVCQPGMEPGTGLNRSPPSSCRHGRARAVRLLPERVTEMAARGWYCSEPHRRPGDRQRGISKLCSVDVLLGFIPTFASQFIAGLPLAGRQGDQSPAGDDALIPERRRHRPERRSPPRHRGRLGGLRFRVIRSFVAETKPPTEAVLGGRSHDGASR